jgi:hypothetical protein
MEIVCLGAEVRKKADQKNIRAAELSLECAGKLGSWWAPRHAKQLEQRLPYWIKTTQLRSYGN